MFRVSVLTVSKERGKALYGILGNMCADPCGTVEQREEDLGKVPAVCLVVPVPEIHPDEIIAGFTGAFVKFCFTIKIDTTLITKRRGSVK